MKKKKLVIIICISLGVLILLGFLIGIKIYKSQRIKNAKVEVVLKSDLEISFLEKVNVSDFIESINGKIEDDYKIDTTKVGKQEIKFKYVNEEGIKLDYSFKIDIKDVTPPLVWLSDSYNVPKGSKDTVFAKILCGDDYDPRPKCEVEGDYNLDEVGSYQVVFKAVDSSNNITEHPFTLNVNEPKSSGSSNTEPKKTTAFSDVVKNYKTDNTQIGIDVSKWQGDIDFAALKEAGVEFIIIRVGTSDGIDGDRFIDSKFEKNIKGANEAGIPVGLYFYSYANTRKKAIEDAKWILKQIKGYKVDLPIAFDWENWNSFNEFNVSFFGLTDMASAFLDTLKEKGYDGLLYSSKTYLENMWMPIDYPTWLAHYVSNTNYEGDYEYWQLCNNGRVDGIFGDVDIDIRYIKEKAN